MFRIATNTVLLSLLSVSLLTLLPLPAVEAGPRAMGHARASVNRAPPAGAQRAQRINPRQNVAGNRVNDNRQVAANRQVNSNRQVNAGNRANINNGTRNVNIDNHRDVDIDVDGGGRWGYDDDYHPIATAAAVTATVVATSAVVGAIFRPAQLPPDCVQVMRYNTPYLQCGSTWFQPQYQGSNVTYVVVNAP
ncbi:hypothetical protein [Pseudomonas rubra]|uniref:Uncharacterized protein n=1 Tax=Pseudomonas rubra TaxID=2942627 RepID=A0ABT5PFS9_9PSED|nr:hypothetical protein [Pseudomonas rubra]MDD1017123.1 hypothetical protein [Pseudomonas rubra]MDD1037135.1 hypothetical protein [Pseudomonas rubra]MDD1153796.1 hypothetical protein [Pseudomonas rubra]